jgi:hypothetical protein
MFSPVNKFLEIMMEKRRRFLTWVEGQFTSPAPLPPVLIRSRTTPSDPAFRGVCVFVFAGNGRTKGSYPYLGIPMRFLTEGVNRFFAFRDDLTVIVELVPDEEMPLPRFRERGYRLGLERGSFTIFIPESRKDDIIELSSRGFTDLCRHLGLPGWHEKLHREIVPTITQPSPPPPPSPVPAPQDAEEFESEESAAGEGVPVVFFTLLIKMASLERKYPGGVEQYVEDADPCEWLDDGRLLRTVSMENDFDPFVGLLTEKGLQCTEAPADFYVLDGGPGIPRWAATFLTLDDGGLKFDMDEEGRVVAQLREEEVTP